MFFLYLTTNMHIPIDIIYIYNRNLN